MFTDVYSNIIERRVQMAEKTIPKPNDGSSELHYNGGTSTVSRPARSSAPPQPKAEKK